MNLGSRLSRWLAENHATAMLTRDGQPVSEAVPLAGWIHGDKGSRAEVTFGPYPKIMRATGVRVLADGATDDIEFGGELSLPVGSVYRYTVTVGVRRA